MNRRRFLAIGLAALPLSAHANKTRVWSGQALGSDASITIAGDHPDTLARDVEQLVRRIRVVESVFSLFNPESEISRLNRDGKLDDPSRMLIEVLTESATVHRITGGLFDPTIQPMWQAVAWGGDVEAARSRFGFDLVQFDRTRIEFARPDMGITLNGIAQGYATDQIVTLMRALGYTHGLVNVGEYAAIGGGWRTGVQDTDGRLISIATLADNAVATSSPNAMQLGRLGHIMHPGHQPQWKTVSVEADTATLADGLSTALVFADASLIERASNLDAVRRIVRVPV